MATFEDFVRENTPSTECSEEARELEVCRDQSAVSGLTVLNVSTAVSSVFNAAALPGIGKSERDELSAHVAEVVSSDSFISELSSRLGDPKLGETENEFVARARMAFRSMMHQRLRKK